MSGKARNLVAKAFGGNDRNFLADTLVDLEITGHAGIVLLNNDAGSLLNSLRANTPLLVFRRYEREIRYHRSRPFFALRR